MADWQSGVETGDEQNVTVRLESRHPLLNPNGSFFRVLASC